MLPAAEQRRGHGVKPPSRPLHARIRCALRLVQAKSMPFQQIKPGVSMRERHFAGFGQLGGCPNAHAMMYAICG
jgi:hypothetical protein